jgi:hypothetical protein
LHKGYFKSSPISSFKCKSLYLKHMLSGQKKLKRVKQVMKELEMLKNVNQLLIQFQHMFVNKTLIMFYL